MAVAGVSQAIASQHEFVRPELELLYITSSRLWSRIKSRTDIKPVSNRPARIPLEVLSGGKFRAEPTNFNGGDMGQGSGPTQTFGSLSCTSFLQASEYTALTEYSTDSDEKAIKNYVTLTHQRAAETMAGYMDAVFQGDGSNTLDTVVAIAAGGDGYVVNNANLFQDNQDIDVWTAVGGTFVGTVTILSQDIDTNTIWLTGPVATGSAAGYKLLVSGSAGVANSGLLGLRAYNVGGNAGTFMGIPRSSFPGKFSTPNINLAGGSLVPAVVRACENKIKLALGIDRADAAEIVAHCNVDMQAAWENNALLIQRIVLDKTRGDKPIDTLTKEGPTMIAGREMLVNERAVPGIIDFLALKHWFRIETKPLDMHEVGGQTLFPAYGQSGGLESSILFYLTTMVQTGLAQPRMDAYLSNVAVPTNYFLH